MPGREVGFVDVAVTIGVELFEARLQGLLLDHARVEVILGNRGAGERKGESGVAAVLWALLMSYSLPRGG